MLGDDRCSIRRRDTEVSTDAQRFQQRQREVASNHHRDRNTNDDDGNNEGDDGARDDNVECGATDQTPGRPELTDAVSVSPLPEPSVPLWWSSAPGSVFGTIGAAIGATNSTSAPSSNEKSSSALAQ